MGCIESIPIKETPKINNEYYPPPPIKIPSAPLPSAPPAENLQTYYPQQSYYPQQTNYPQQVYYLKN